MPCICRSKSAGPTDEEQSTANTNSKAIGSMAATGWLHESQARAAINRAKKRITHQTIANSRRPKAAKCLIKR